MLNGEWIGRVVEVALGEDTLVGDGLNPMSIRPAVALEGNDIARVVAAGWLGDNERADWRGSSHTRCCDEKDTHAKRHHHSNEASKTEAQDGGNNNSLLRHAPSYSRGITRQMFMSVVARPASLGRLGQRWRRVIPRR